MCTVIRMWALFLIGIIIQTSGVAGVDRWTAFSTTQNSALTFANSGSSGSYGVLSTYTLPNVITSAGDKVLILVNCDYYREGSAANKFMFNFKLNANSADVGIGPFTDLANKDAREFQPCNFMYLYTPAATTTTFAPNVHGGGKLSGRSQTRTFDAMVFPSSYTMQSFTSTTTVTVSGAGNNYQAWSDDVTVNLSSPTDRVLLLMSVPFGTSSTASHGAFTFYRGGSTGNVLAPNLVVQTVGAVDSGVKRHVTGAYVDVPGTTGNIAYAGMVRKLTTPGGASNDFTLLSAVRSLIAIVIPESYVVYQQISNSQLIASWDWTPIDGLSVTTTVADPSDYVTIIVNVNFDCITGSSTVGLLSIFADETSIALNGTIGHHIIRVIRKNETVASSMTAVYNPGTTAPVSYSVRGRAESGAFMIGGFGQVTSITVLRQSVPATAAPTQFPTRKPTAKPTAVPTTVTPTLAPTAKPTWTPSTATPTVVPTAPTAVPTTVKPSAVPTRPTAVPTAAPTQAPADCTVSCSILNGDVTSVVERTAVRNVLLRTSFTIKFDVVVPQLYTAAMGDAVYLLNLVNQANQRSLLAVKLTTSRGIGLAYNGTSIDDYSVELEPNFATVPTTIKITVANCDVRAQSSTDIAWNDPHPIPTQVDTTGQIYSLLVAGPPGGAGTLFSNFVITGTRR